MTASSRCALVTSSSQRRASALLSSVDIVPTPLCMLLPCRQEMKTVASATRKGLALDLAACLRKRVPTSWIFLTQYKHP